MQSLAARLDRSRLHLSSELITTQSYTVGLLGWPPALASTPSAILAAPRRSFFQPSDPFGVGAEPKGESGTLAGDDGVEGPDSLPRGDVTDSAGGRRMVMLRVTAGASAAAAAAEMGDGDAAIVEEEEEGEKEAYLRSLPRPESGRGPATVSSQSWSRSPMLHAA